MSEFRYITLREEATIKDKAAEWFNLLNNNRYILNNKCREEHLIQLNHLNKKMIYHSKIINQ